MKPLIYTAGPYSGNPVAFTRNAILTGETIEALGCNVFIPHLTLLWDLISPAPVDVWYRRDDAILVRCDAVFRIAGISSGAEAEVALALDHNIPVFHNLSTLDDWAAEWRAHRQPRVCNCRMAGCVYCRTAGIAAP